jgi:hypothetical protein
MNKIARPLKMARRPAFAVGTVLAVSLVAAASGGGASAAPAPAPSFAPAASGTIASIFGQSLEVQGTQGQTTVNLTAKTVITATVPLALKDVVKGACISASGTKGTGGKVDATLVTIEPSVKGNCTVGGGGFRGAPGGAFPGRTSGTVPSRFRAPTNTAEAFGKVTSVSGSKIVVQGISVAGFGRPAKSTPVPVRRTLPKPGPVTVIVSSKTRYQKTERVNSSALKVGECATAIGSTNNIGVVTATRLTVTQPTDGSCTTGFGGFGGFGRGASFVGPAAGAMS